MTDKLDVEAALLAAPSKIGGKAQGSQQTLAEMKKAGLVSPRGNLTAKGVAKRGQVMDRRLDEAFG